ncbi:MAG: hypothetical protein JXD18_00170 [Anaerolineae bacterium]|nr:hypothetical protein [Anaerolineae bacterium]
MNHRGTFLILAAGAILGLMLGLVYAWLIDPVDLYNTTPDLLRSDYLHEWVRLTALGYVVDGNVERVQARLAPVNDADVQAAFAALIESYATQGRPAETIRALSYLAEQIGVYTPAMDIYLGADAPPTPGSIPSPSPQAPIPTVVLSPTPTFPAPPTLSPLPTPRPSPYRVVTQTLLCEGTPPQLQVLVRQAPPPAPPVDEEEQEEAPLGPLPLPGVVLWLTWPGGADRAVTGLRPLIDPGYADFTLEPDTPYALSVDEPNAPVISGLTVQTCPGEEGTQPRLGTWYVVLEIEARE